MPIIEPFEGYFFFKDKIPRLMINTFTDRNMDIEGYIIVDLKDRFINLGEIDPECDIVFY